MSAQAFAASSAAQKPARAHPTFFGALRGVWLLTWKSQTTWRRLAGAGLGLLALPLLVYLTTSSPREWAQNHGLHLGNPSVFLSGFSRRLARIGDPLPPQQQSEVTRILREEFGRAERDWAENMTSEPTADEQRQQSDLADGRILQRVQPLLDERQFTEFQAYQKRHRSQRNVPAGERGWSRTAPFYHCLIDLYFFIILPLNCVRLCGGLIRDELEADTLSFLTTRPLSRAQLLIVKFLSQTAWLQIWLLAQTLLLFAVGQFRQIPDLGTMVPLFLGAQFLAVLAWGALGLFLGQISKRYMALALLYGSVVEMGIGRIPTNINSLSLMRHLQTLLSHNPALQNVFNWPTAGFAAPVSALVLAASIFLILAAILFTYLEYHHTTEMQR